MRLAEIALIAGSPAILVTLAIACGDPSHIYEAHSYDEEHDCLGAKDAVDVVEGDRPGNCPPVCLVDRRVDGGRVVYVSGMCGPYPVDLDRTGTDPACPRALAALARGAFCISDGGSTAPLPVDAAGD